MTLTGAPPERALVTMTSRPGTACHPELLCDRLSEAGGGEGPEGVVMALSLFVGVELWDGFNYQQALL